MCEDFALSEKEYEPVYLYIFPIRAPGRWLELLNLSFKILMADLVSVIFRYDKMSAPWKYNIDYKYDERCDHKPEPPGLPVRR